MCKLAQSIKYHMFPTKAKIPKVTPSAIMWSLPSANKESDLWTFLRKLGFASGDDAEASQVSPSKVSQIAAAPSQTTPGKDALTPTTASKTADPATTSPKNAAPSQKVAPSKKPASDSSVKGPHTCSYGINCLFPNLVPIDCQKCALENKEVKVCIYHVYTVYMLYIF